MITGDHERKVELRKILIELRDETLNKIAQEMGTKLEEDPRISTLSSMDTGDLSQLDLDGDIDYAIMNMYIEKLRSLEDVLDRLEDGTYGYCEDCGQPIVLERLKALPFTKYCIQCQEQQEKSGQRSKLKKMKRGEEFRF